MEDQKAFKVQVFDNLLARVKQDMCYGTLPAQMPDNELADYIVNLRALSSMVEKREKLLTTVLKARYDRQIEELLASTEEQPPLVIKGQITEGLVVIPVTQKRFDSDLVKEEMGEDWYEDHCKSISFVQIRAAKKGD